MKITTIIRLVLCISLIQGCSYSTPEFNKTVILDVEGLSTEHDTQQTNPLITPQVKQKNDHENNQQNISLFGCNNIRKDQSDLIGGQSSSVSLPYGWHNDDGKNFFVAQYYVEFPSVPTNPKKGQKTTLGLLSKDNFRFETQVPSKTIKLNYNALEPMYLSHLSVDFGSCKGKVDYVPIRTSCPEYPHVNGNKSPVAGIDIIEDKRGYGEMFIPTRDEGGVNPLQCKASILNDIQLHYKIGFSVGDVVTDNINLTQQLIEQLHPNGNNNSGQIITLICDERPRSAPLPSGCKF